MLSNARLTTSSVLEIDANRQGKLEQRSRKTRREHISVSSLQKSKLSVNVPASRGVIVHSSSYINIY